MVWSLCPCLLCGAGFCLERMQICQRKIRESEKILFQQENQGMGNKVQFYTALFARVWEYRAEAVAAFQGGAGICSFPN